MKVVFDVSYVQKKSAGIGRYSFELLVNLLETDLKNEYILYGWSFNIDRDRLKALAGENVFLSLRRIPGQIKRFYWNRARVPALQSLVGPFDLFHASEPLLPPMQDVPGIVTVHDLAHLRHPELFERNVLTRDAFVRRAIHESAAIIVPSLYTKTELIDLLGVDEKKIRLIRPPVHRGCSPIRDSVKDEEVRRKYHLDAPFALFVGVLEPRKNVAGIIRAFEQIHTAHRTDLDLVIVGRNGWLFQETVQAILRSHERARIHRLQYVPDIDLVSLYRLATFFVYPSHYEGYGSPVAEAMASGLPTITSRNTSLQEFGDGAAVLVDPRNTEEIAAAMLELTENGSARARLAASGPNRIREIHAESAARLLVALYDEVGHS